MAELSERRRVVPRHPHLRNLAILQTEEGREVELHPSSGGRERPHRSSLSALVRCPHGNEVALCYDVPRSLDRIREDRGVLPQELLEALEAPHINVRSRLAMANEVGVYDVV